MKILKNIAQWPQYVLEFAVAIMCGFIVVPRFIGCTKKHQDEFIDICKEYGNDTFERCCISGVVMTYRHIDDVIPTYFKKYRTCVCDAYIKIMAGTYQVSNDM